MGVSVVRQLYTREATSSKFTSSLNDYLVSVRNRTPTRDRGGMISPSQVGGCQQWALNQLRAEQRENHSSPWDKPFLDMANLYHDYYQNLSVKAGILEPTSIERRVIYKPLKIGGAIDGRFVRNGPLVDFKTANSRIFSRIVERNQVKNYGVEMQMHCYMKAEHVNDVIVVYINRDTPSQLHEIHYKWDDKVWKDVTDWIEPVILHFEAGTDFEDLARHKLTNQECHGCQYFAHCRGRFMISNEGKKMLV